MNTFSYNATAITFFCMSGKYSVSSLFAFYTALKENVKIDPLYAKPCS